MDTSAALRKIVSNALLGIILTAGSIGTATAQGLPQPEQLRIAYDQTRARSGLAPQIVLQAFVASLDRNFTSAPPERSAITDRLAQMFIPHPVTPENRQQVIRSLAQVLSHEEILDWYAHQTFLGNNCYGIDASSLIFFGKEPDTLEPHEAATLAAMAASPNRLHPVNGPDQLIARRNYILLELAKVGNLTTEDAETAIQQGLGVVVPLGRCPSR